MSIFNNLQIAFKDKSNYDLNRAYLLFKIISIPFISKIMTKFVKLSISFGIPIEFIIKKTIYAHFCGGISIEKSQNTIDKLWKSNIGTILDFSAEGKNNEIDFNRVLNETILSINKAKNQENIPFAVFKPTGLIRFTLLEKLSSKKKLTDKEEIESDDFKQRFYKICQKASENNIPVFIDAEESWIQNAVDKIVLNFMKKYNHEKVLIFNTIQMYRNDRVDYLNNIIDIGNKEKFKIGLKIVRGAYHEKEIDRAKKYNYNIPVHLKKEDTDKDFNKALEICVQNIVEFYKYKRSVVYKNFCLK